MEKALRWVQMALAGSHSRHTIEEEKLSSKMQFIALNLAISNLEIAGD